MSLPKGGGLFMFKTSGDLVDFRKIEVGERLDIQPKNRMRLENLFIQRW